MWKKLNFFELNLDILCPGKQMEVYKKFKKYSDLPYVVETFWKWHDDTILDLVQNFNTFS